MLHSRSRLQSIWVGDDRGAVCDDEDAWGAAAAEVVAPLVPPPVEANGFTIGASAEVCANDE